MCQINDFDYWYCWDRCRRDIRWQLPKACWWDLFWWYIGATRHIPVIILSHTHCILAVVYPKQCTRFCCELFSSYHTLFFVFTHVIYSIVPFTNTWANAYLPRWQWIIYKEFGSSRPVPNKTQQCTKRTVCICTIMHPICVHNEQLQLSKQKFSFS